MNASAPWNSVLNFSLFASSDAKSTWILDLFQFRRIGAAPKRFGLFLRDGRPDYRCHLVNPRVAQACLDDETPDRSC